MACAWISICGFILRGVWMLRGSPLLRLALTRRLAMSIDSLLLLSALGLATISGQWPLQQAWLSAKLAALLLYIGLGMVALHWGRNRVERGAALGAAILTFAYIVGVATSRQPIPW
ncbi:regulator SirB [Halieaceae bacterium IMCC14734]|uniref:Regulator SirB n=2 Tax=Candidatus Litorirhabdus singularis TaxID=2518993 RepID=A0ABT3THG6_9GAMM|nr:regulator SirB [Candidatus Litorirhabdus singularis]